MGWFDDAVEWVEDTTGYEVDEDAWGENPWPDATYPDRPDDTPPAPPPHPDTPPPQYTGGGSAQETEDAERARRAAEEEEAGNAALYWACLVARHREDELDPNCPPEEELDWQIQDMSDEELERLDRDAFGEEEEGEEEEPYTGGGTGGGGTGGGGKVTKTPEKEKESSALPWIIGAGVATAGVVGLGVFLATRPKKRAA